MSEEKENYSFFRVESPWQTINIPDHQNRSRERKGKTTEEEEEEEGMWEDEDEV